MKIIRFVILISFLFNSVGYPYDVLRPPMLGDKVNKVRLESMGKLASGQNLEAIDQGESSANNYKSNWTVKIWREAKKAVRERFENTKERGGALFSVKFLVIRLAENKIDPSYTLYAIPAVVKAVKTSQELGYICDALFNLNIKLAKNKINPHYMLWLVTPVVAKAAKDFNELKLFVELGIRLAENKINPSHALEYAIPAVAKLAKTPEELKDICDLLLELNIKFARSKIDPSYTLRHAIPAVAKIAGTMQELKDIWDTPLLTLNIKLDDTEIEPGDILQSVMSVVAEAPKIMQELKDAYSCLILKVDEAIEKKWNRYKKRANGLAVTTELISDIIQIKRKYGDFRLVFMPSYGYEKSFSPAYFKVLPPAPPSLRKVATGWLTKIISRGL